jgi:hypothetical protein
LFNNPPLIYSHTCCARGSTISFSVFGLFGAQTL